MSQAAASAKFSRVLSHVPEELTRGKLRRLGEGIGKVVYASEHWVVKRERPASEIIALIVIWKFLRKASHILPARVSERLLSRPSKRIKFLRIVMQGMVLLVPRSIWFTTHIGEVWRVYHTRDIRGESLAKTHLAGTSLIPERVTFPPVRVEVGGWPGWLAVSEATERVDCTLHHRLVELTREAAFEEVEVWLNRLLDLRQLGWEHGLFSTDAHLKNFGVMEDRVVLLDLGGLTDEWSEIESRLSFEREVTKPHALLGLGKLLHARPDIAARFDERWKSIVNIEHIRDIWRKRAGQDKL